MFKHAEITSQIQSFASASIFEIIDDDEIFTVDGMQLNRYSLSQKSIINSVQLLNGLKSVQIKYLESRSLVCSISDNFFIEFYDADTLEFKSSHKLNSKDFTAKTIDANADQSMIAVGTHESTVAIWDIDNSTIVSNLKKYSSHAVNLVKFLKIDGYSEEILAICNSDNKVLLYGLKTRRIIATLDKHVALVTGITCFKFPTTAEIFVACFSLDKTITIWSIGEWSCKRIYPCYQKISAICSVGSESEIICSTGDSLFQFNFKGVKELSLDPLNDTDFDGSIFNIANFGDNILLSTGNNYFYCVDKESGKICDAVLGQIQIRSSVQYLIDDWIVFINSDCKFICVDLTTRNQKVFSITTDSTINGFKVIADLESIVCWCSNGSLITFSYKNFDDDGIVARNQFEAASSSIECAAFFGSSTLISAIGCKDGSLRVIQLDLTRNGALKTLATIKAHSKVVSEVIFSKKSKQIITTSLDRTIKIWSTDSLVNLGVLSGHKRGTNKLEVCDDNTMLSSSPDGIVKQWSLANYSCLKTFEDSSKSKNIVLKSLSANSFVSFTASGFLRVWDVSKMIHTTSHSFSDDDLVFNYALFLDDTRLLVCANEKFLVLTDTTAEAEAKKQAEETRKVEMNQKLLNLMHDNKFSEAFALLIEFKMFNQLVEASGKINDTVLKQIIAEFDEEILSKFLSCVSELNKVRKHRFAAQRLLNLIILTMSTEKLCKIPEMSQLIDSLSVYTKRHLARIEELLMHSHFINFAKNFDTKIAQENKPTVTKSDIQKPTANMPTKSAKSAPQDSSKQISQAKRRKVSKDDCKEDVGLFLLNSANTTTTL